MAYAGIVTALTAVTVSVSGCSGVLVDKGGNTFPTREASAQAIIDDVTAINPTSFDDMPSGTGSYLGQVIMDITINSDDDRVIGDLGMSADFDFGTVGGTVDNLFAENAGIVGGELEIFGGDIIVTWFTAGIDGTLTISGDNYDLDGDVIGEFHGVGANAVSGVFAGDVFDEGALPIIGDFSGEFAAD